ncbi:MAG: S8 family peptidase [Proteobacteria bacterium]|jgi:serine protease|nr:S8 family peptidase [Pseudomonadota bacterium]
MKRHGFAWVLFGTAIAASLAIAPAGAQQARFIVKFRDSGAVTQAVRPEGARVAKLAAATRTPLQKLRDMGLGAEVVIAQGIEPGAGAEAVAARLAANPGVEFAAVDHRRYPLQAYPTNDQYVGSQFYLFNGPTGINAFDAWTVTHGSADVTVAVIDTGYRPHVDLAGRFLPGYDMISDPAVANNSYGRGPDATDPGDWLTPADVATGQFAGCDARWSSWHGTSVSGVIAADVNNVAFTAGIDWNAKILPVRVLGRCGGYDSDIVDGILWAAGLPVPGVPDNPHPAQILNLSLGGDSPCASIYPPAIAAAYQHGVTRAIVVAAGNSSEDVSKSSPANCPGVIAVASSTTTGNLAAYSNYGSGVLVSAPGGSSDPSFTDQVVVVLSNLGSEGPTTDTVKYEGGTSFSAPMVSGTIALMLAVNPALTLDQIESILASTASPFVAGSDCTTARCGAGVVDAYTAVLAAKALAGGGPPPPQANYQGLWWASPAESESGWGLNVAHQGNTIFATWFTYDATGKALWLSMTAVEGTPGVFSGQMVETNGPPFSAVPFNPSLVTRTVVGNGTLTFTDANDGSFNYTVNGVTQTKPITREVFGPLPVCTFGGLANLAQATNFQDLWWASPANSQSGWGINLTEQGRTIFATWFTYDVDGTPLWLSVTATPSGSATTPQGAPAVWSGQLLRTAGPAFSAVPFNPSLVTRSVVGSATFTFTDGANGTFAYTVNGIGPATVTQSKTFTREVFVAPGTACQ